VKAARSVKAIAFVLALLLGALIVLLLWARQPSPPSTEPVTLLPAPFKAPANRRDEFTRALGPNRRWVQRAEGFLFGRRRSFDVFAEVILLPPASVTNVESALQLTQPVFTDTNQLRIWFFNSVQLKDFSAKMEKLPEARVLSRPRLSMAEEMEGSIFVGTSVPMPTGVMHDVGFHLQCAGALGADFTELLTGINHSEFAERADKPTIRTNIDLVARLKIPKGSGVLLLKHPTGETTTGYGIVIHPLQ
jgi:hypothetical protein